MQSLHSISAYGEALSLRAQELRDCQDSPPIYIGKACRQLSIRIKRDPGTHDGKSYLKWDRAENVRPTILLPAIGHPRWDRFLAAHEIGHYFLISDFNWIPNSDNAYWKTEIICDQFARDLLIPPSVLDSIDQLDNMPLSTVYQSTRQLARFVEVPWTQFAIHFTNKFPVFLFFKIRRFEGSWKVEFSSAPGAAGRFSKLRTRSPICAILNRAAGSIGEDWRKRQHSLSISDFRGSEIGLLLKRMKVIDIEMLMYLPGPSVVIISKSVRS